MNTIPESVRLDLLDPADKFVCENHLHPRVEVDLDRLVLSVRRPHPYEVDLGECTDSAQLLDYILQVSGKGWCDRALAGELLAAVQTACRLRFGTNAQGVFCPCGTARQVDWRRGTSRDPRRR
ncbi:MAG: hypothetical protein H7A46_25660 [Verrucomicrobiales bacterium]|nr:hypothetical protein [Verrucomicrobiales bacterium]